MSNRHLLSVLVALIIWLGTGFLALVAETRSTAQTSAVSSESKMEDGDYARCIAELKSNEVFFEPLGIFREKGCELTGAIRLHAVGTAFGKVIISGDPTMLCSFARQFTGWVKDVGAPLTLAYTGQGLAVIETGPGLVCRTRYNIPGEKVSEHAKGNAIDIASFLLANMTRIPVKETPATTPTARTLIRTFRATGCGYFTTVLGPGSNAAHEAHLHFDYGFHGKTNNYRICD
jgi:hypothetical protein